MAVIGSIKWSPEEEQILIDSYKTHTIMELKKIFSDKSADSINSKIKRLKAEDKISGNKNKDTIERALRQRKK